MLNLSKSPRTPDELLAVPVPETAHWLSRAKDSRWRPIQHGELAYALLEEAHRLGLRVARDRWVATGPELTELYGCIDFHRTASLEVPDDIVFSIGVRHSNAGRYALNLVTGGHVIVCTNGLLMGERVVCRRHTHDLDLREAVREGICDAMGQMAEMGAWVRRLKRTEVTDSEADLVMMAGAREGVLSWSALRHVDRAWRRPPHQDFEPRTAWSLYNAFTEVARDRSPEVQLKALRGLRAVFEPAELLRVMSSQPGLNLVGGTATWGATG